MIRAGKTRRVPELDPPDDGTAVEWLLITSLPIESPDVLRVADYSVDCWPIEITLDEE